MDTACRPACRAPSTFLALHCRPAGTAPAQFGYSVTGMTNGSSDCITAPGAPTNVAAAAVPGYAKAVVSWTAPSSDGGSPIMWYTVTCGSTCGGSPGSIKVTCYSSPCTVTGLTSGGSYTFTVKAFNAANGGTASAATAAVTPIARERCGCCLIVKGVGASYGYHLPLRSTRIET